ncbi:MAG: hypothetical protein ACU0CC_15885 [Sagittula sp.]|uniref:hypothetical protein n=1 Tax=Sagittula sp. TaxID=2038081 RepID=UPI004058C135
MTRLATAALLAASVLAAPALADVGPSYLPNLTFPDNGPKPATSTQGQDQDQRPVQGEVCTLNQPTTCR